MKSGRALEPGTVTNPQGGCEAAVPATLTTNRLGAYRAALTHLRWQRDQISVVIEQLAALVAEHAPEVVSAEALIDLKHRVDPVYRATRAKSRETTPPPSPTRVARGPAGSLLEIKAKVLADLAKRTNASPKDLQLAIFSKVTPSAVKLLRDALRQLEAEHLVVAEGHTTTRRYRRVVKPNGKAAGDEFEVAWSGSSKRPLTVQEPA